MHTVNLIAKAIPVNEQQILPPLKPEMHTCCLTGQQEFCIPRKNLFGASFTNIDLLAAPTSQYVGIDAFVALKYRAERMSSWYCDGKIFMKLRRQEVREKVIRGVYSNVWAGYVTTSYKKHGALFAKLNSGNKVIWRFEMLDVDCSNHEKLMFIWNRLNLELRSGIVRPVLESLISSPFLIYKIGLKRWLDFYEWALPLYQGSLYKFMCYLLPSQEELKNENLHD